MTNITKIRTEADAQLWLSENGITMPELVNGCVVIPDVCGRCGGSGRGPWLQDGGRCYACGGANTRNRARRVAFKRWVQETKASLIRREKAAEIRRAQNAAAQERSLEGQRNWCEANGYGRITFEERDAQRKAAEAAKAATRVHVGTVGERREFTVKVIGIPSWDNAFGTVYCHLMEDADGNSIVWKASGTGLHLGDLVAEKGDLVTLVATIKEHGERNGSKQTIVSRAKAKSITKAGSEVAKAA